MSVARGFAAALLAVVGAGASGCQTIVVAPEIARAKRVVLCGFQGNRDVELALANTTFIQSRHDGEEIVPKALAVFSEKLHRMGRFALLPPEVVTTTAAWREYRPSRFRFHEPRELVCHPKLKLVNGEDVAALGAIARASGVDAVIAVEATLTTEVRIAEGDTGSAGGRVRLDIRMIAPDGRALWSDIVVGNSPDLARISGGTYLFPNEIARVVLQAFEAASEDAVARLRRRMP